MKNLVDEFFNRNLSEAQAQELEDLLGDSPEEASRFGEKMRLEYLALGLPVPTIPRHLAHSSTGLSVAKLALLAAAFSGGILAWSFWPHPAFKTAVTAPAVEKELVPAILPRVKTQLPPPPVQVPQRLAGTTAEGNRLSVVVELDKPAPVEVCILDPKDRMVRNLYQGSLASGKWSIHWDGLLSDGSPAPAGNYRIRVKSGAAEMSKNVDIEGAK